MMFKRISELNVVISIISVAVVGCDGSGPPMSPVVDMAPPPDLTPVESGGWCNATTDCAAGLSCIASWESDWMMVCVAPGVGSQWEVQLKLDPFHRDDNLVSVDEKTGAIGGMLDFTYEAASDCNKGSYVVARGNAMITGSGDPMQGTFTISWPATKDQYGNTLHAGSIDGTLVKESAQGSYTLTVDWTRNDCSLSPFTATTTGSYTVWRCHCPMNQTCVPSYNHPFCK